MEAGPPPSGPINPYAAPQTPADLASVPATTAAHDLTREEVEAFVGNKHTYYWRRWQRAAGVRAGFNIAAFLVSFAWLLYRKMYREFAIGLAILLGVGFLQGLVESLAETKLGIPDRLLDFAVAFTVGMLGNGLYLRRARLAIASARAQEPDPERRAELLRARGGTSLIALLIGIAAFIALGVFAAMAG